MAPCPANFDDKVYKFLPTSRIDDVVKRGFVKIGSLSHYRKLETEAQWIADKLEGQIVLDTGEIVVTDSSSEVDQMLPPSLAGRHIVVENGGQVIFAPGVKVTIEHPDVYIFSASKGELSDLKRTMCNEAAEPYDGCLQILDLRHLAHRMFHRGIVDALGGTRMTKLFQSFECSEVIYDVLFRKRGSGRAPEVSPFLKDKFFSGQQEVRIVFHPHRPIPVSTFTVRVPRPGQLFKEVFRAAGECVTARSSSP